MRGSPYPEFVIIRIVNLGARPVRINGLGWRGGVFRKAHAIQTTGLSPESLALGVHNSPLPVTLNEGEDAAWHVRLDDRTGWLQAFAKDFCRGPFPRIAARALRVQAVANTGRIFSARPEPEFRRRLVAAALAHRAKLGG